MESSDALDNEIYTPLDPQKRQIRLLHLSPDPNQNSRIHCSLETVSLYDDSLQYEALSYVWGDRSKQETIEIHGQQRKVTTNLFEALTNIRHATEERTMWVDAVCINQKDMKERAEQVKIMRDIFAGALAVVIYLGPTWPGIEHAWHLFDTIGRDVELHMDHGFTPSIASHGIDLASNDISGAIEHFMSHPWWQRIWTVQEWHLARTAGFQCGRQTIDADLVFRTALHVGYHFGRCCYTIAYWPVHEKLKRSLLPQATMIMRRDQMQNTAVNVPEDFLSLVASFRARNSTDARDKIYGILGLAGDIAPGIEVDYSAPVEKVYTDFAISMIRQCKTFDILGFNVRTTDMDLPSWVPDWSAPIDPLAAEDLVFLRRMHFPHVYDACGGKDARFERQNDKLVIKGRIVDSLTVIQPFNNNLLTERAEVWNRFVEGHSSDEDERLKRKNIYLMALCGGLQVDPSTHKYERRPPIVDSSPFDRLYAYDQNPQGAIDLEVELIARCIVSTSSARTLTLTQSDRVGWVPMMAKAGDTVVILTGGRAPLVLRPGAEGYTLVGEAYIHGLMNGEGMLDDDTLEDIVLL